MLETTPVYSKVNKDLYITFKIVAGASGHEVREALEESLELYIIKHGEKVLKLIQNNPDLLKNKEENKNE